MEKDYNPEQKMAKAMKKQAKAVPKTEKPAKVVKSEASKEEQTNEVKTTPKKSVQKKEIVKKDFAIVYGKGLAISTKDSMAVCKFIKNKSIEKALADLGEVLKKRKAVPMKGEIPHKRGKGMMSGRYPKKAAENFIKLLKTLRGNSNVNGVEEPVIVEAVPNMGSRPYGKFGIRRKRTHVMIKAVEGGAIKKIQRRK